MCNSSDVESQTHVTLPSPQINVSVYVCNGSQEKAISWKLIKVAAPAAPLVTATLCVCFVIAYGSGV